MKFICLGQTFSLVSRLVAESPQALDNAGISVAISDNYMAVGAWGDDNRELGSPMIEAGAVYLYQKQADDSWQLLKKLFSSEPELLGYYGFSVALTDRTLVVGAYNEQQDEGGLPNAGAAYVYQIATNGAVEEVARLRAPDPGRTDFFGYSVAIEANTIVIGAYLHEKDLQGENDLKGAGAAYVFQNENGQWAFMQKLVSEGRQAGDNFGKFLDISADHIIIGAEDVDQALLIDAGSAYIYTYDQGSKQWMLEQQLFASDSESFKDFGWDVAIDGDLALIGASAEFSLPDGTFGSNSGAVYAFHRNPNGEWIETEKIYAPDYTQGDFFGRAIAIDGNYAIIGADMEDEDEMGTHTIVSAGSVYIFRWENGSWTFVQKVVGTERKVGDWFGSAVDIHWPNLAVGAWNADVMINNGTVNDAGAAYIFQTEEGISTASFDLAFPDPKIYPNPASNYLHVEMEDNSATTLMLYNSSGQPLKKLLSEKGLIDVSGLSSGQYFIQFLYEKQYTRIIPWVKQ